MSGVDFDHFEEDDAFEKNVTEVMKAVARVEDAGDYVERARKSTTSYRSFVKWGPNIKKLAEEYHGPIPRSTMNSIPTDTKSRILQCFADDKDNVLFKKRRRIGLGNKTDVSTRKSDILFLLWL